MPNTFEQRPVSIPAEKIAALELSVKERDAISVEIALEHPDVTALVAVLATTYSGFTPNLNNPATRQQALGFLLARQETARLIDPEYKIANEPLEAVASDLKKDFGLNYAIQEANDKYDDTQILLTVRDQLRAQSSSELEYFEAFATLLADQGALGKKFTEVAAQRTEIEFDGAFSSRLTDRMKLVSDNITALQTIANTAPDYAAKIEEADVDITDRKAVQSFVIQSGFLDDETVDDVVKADVTRRLGLPLNATVATGSDVDSALDAKAADSRPLFNEDNPFAVRDGLEAYVRPDGMRMARVKVEGIGVRELPWRRGETGEVIGLKLSMLKIWSLTEQSGNTDFLGETLHINTVNTSQTDPGKLRRIQQLLNALLGGTAGYDGEIINDDQAAYLSWFQQFISTKGDVAHGDIDAAAALRNRINLGFHPKGDPQKLDFEILKAASTYAQSLYASGEPDYHALRNYLVELFPDRISHMDA